MGSLNNHPEYPDPSLLINVSNFVSVKLSASNYDVWKTQMRCFIDNVGLLHFIDGTTPSPAPPPPSSSSNGTTAVPNEEYWRWRRLDQRLKGWILGSLSEEVLPTVVGLDTASNVWTALQHSFDPYLQPPVQMRGIAEEGIDLCRSDLKKFVESMTTDQLELQTTEGNTALSVAAMVGNKEAAKILVKKDPSLLYIENCNHSLPMHMAAKYGHENTLWDLLTATEDHLASYRLYNPSYRHNPFEGQSGVQLLVDVIISGFIEIALYLVQRYPGLAKLKTEEGDSPLAAIARKPSAFQSGNQYLDFLEEIIYSWFTRGFGPFSDNSERSVSALRGQVAICRGYKNTAGIIIPILRKTWVHIQALELVKCLCTEIRRSNDPYQLQWEKPILVAARLRTHEVVEVIVDAFSNEIWSNKEDRNWIFQLAVEYRCKQVFNLICQKRNQYAFSVPKDASGNNILHIAAKLAPSHTLDHFSGAALQMQSELQWFQAVQMFANPCCKEEENSSKETPQMVFTREHSKLLVEAKKWMKDTANSFTLAAALITTVVFAAAITVPGGNNGSNGLPIFSQRRAFKTFYLSNACSLSLAVTSLLAFLSILTGRCAEEDFLDVLPSKLICGLFTLFASIVCMMISFGVIVYLVYGHMYASLILAGLPIIPLIYGQFGLLQDFVMLFTGDVISIFRRLARRQLS